jgi:hypothetical protein
LQENIIVIVTYMAAGLQQYNSDQLPVIRGNTLVVTLDKLLEPSVMQLSSRLKIVFLRRGTGFVLFTYSSRW